MRRTPSRAIGIGLLAVAIVRPAGALETDQFYTWTQPIADSTEVMNAKVNLELSIALDKINERRSWKQMECSAVAKRITSRFRAYIFHPLELWAINTSLVDRIPQTPDEELTYRKTFLYRDFGTVDMASWVPPSPTIVMNGVRLGTDKIAHFFSEGLWYYRSYRKARRAGLDREQAELRAINRGIRFERTILGLTSSGVFSHGDLEANYQGLLFLIDLCEGDSPALRMTEQGWRMERPFDFRDYVTPEWDESYQPSVYRRSRWAKVRPVLAEYCPLLDEESVRRERRRYDAQDRLTPTEARVREMIAAGKLRDPQAYSLEAVCNSPTTP